MSIAKFSARALFAVPLLVMFSSALQAQNSNPTILITEFGPDLTTGAFEALEIMNVTGDPIDVSGWKLTIYDNSSTPVAGCPVAITGKVLQGGEVYAIGEGNTPLNEVDEAVAPRWNWTSNNNHGGVLLQDDNNNFIDCVFTGGINTSNISSPLSIGSNWSNSPSGLAVFSGANSFQRTGTADNDNAGDWVRPGGDTLGQVNAGLNIIIASSWLGTSGSNWSDAGNWDPIGVPGKDTSVLISAGAASFPVLNGGEKCKNCTVELGARLTLRGDLEIHGSFTNEGGTIDNNGGQLVFAGTEDQSIRPGNTNIGDFSITNVTGVVSFESPATEQWSDKQSGHITAVAGSQISIEPADQSIYDFSNNTADIEGSVTISAPAIAAATLPTLALVMPQNDGFNFGDTTISALDPDAIIIGGHVGFGDLTLTGDGNIDFLTVTFGGNTFPSEVTQMGDFRTTLRKDTVFAGNVLGSGEFNFDGPNAVEIVGDLTSASLIYDSTALLHVLGNIDISGNVRVIGDGNFVGEGDMSAANVTATAGATGIVGDGVINGTLKVEDNAQFEYEGALSATEVLFPGDATLFLGGLSGTAGFGSAAQLLETSGSGTFAFTDIINFIIVEQINFGGSGIVDSVGNVTGNTMEVSGSVDVRIDRSRLTGDLVLNGTGPFIVTNGLTIEGDVDDRNTGVTEIGRLQLFGGIRQFITSDPTNGHVMTLGNLSAVGNGAGELSGVFELAGNGTGFSLFVSNGGGLELTDDTVIDVSSPQIELFRVFGSFVSTPTDASRRPVIRASGAGFNFLFSNGSICSVTGLKLDGVAGQDGMLFQVGSRIAALNGLEVQNANFDLSLIRLQTDEVPAVISGFDPFLSPASPSDIAIDANVVSGFTVNVLRGPLTNNPPAGQSSIFGTNFETDPNNVVIWEAPSNLEITTPTNLPNALVDTQYAGQLTAIGGNQPVIWTLNNEPTWLVVKPSSGLLSGVPPHSSAGSFQFVATVTDATNPKLSASKSFIIVVDELVGVQLQMVLTALVPAEEGRPYGSSLVASGGSEPYTWNLVSGTLPQGLIFTPSGFITGTAAEGTVGTYPIRVRLTDARDEVLERTYNFRVQSAQGQVSSLGHGGASSSCTASQNGGVVSWMWLFFLFVVGGVAMHRRMKADRA